MDPCCADCFAVYNLEGLKLEDFDLGDELDPCGFRLARGDCPSPDHESTVYESISKEAGERGDSITANFASLKLILDNHAATVFRRWRKKSTPQKLKILESSWGGHVPVNHRPDLEAYRKALSRSEAMEITSHDLFVWPYINQEDLLDDEILLLLLHSRGQHHPVLFSTEDLKAMRVGRAYMEFEQPSLDEYVMVFSDSASASPYVQLVRREKIPTLKDSSGTSTHSPSEGLMILEAQDRVLSFLVSCTRHLLHDVDLESLAASPKTPLPPILEPNTSGNTSWSTMAREAPYKVPLELDLASIVPLLEAKRDEVADHLMSLREDPGYFTRQIKAAHNHRGKSAPHSATCYCSHRKPLGWGRTIAAELRTTYVQVEMWSSICKQALEIQTMKTKYDDGTSYGDSFESGFLQAILVFRHALSNLCISLMEHLEDAIMTAIPEVGYVLCQCEAKKVKNFDKTTQKLTFLLILFCQSQRRSLIWVGITTAMDELERFLEKNVTAKKTITPYMASMISDISIAAQCLNQFDHYQPWAKMYKPTMAQKRKKIQSICADMFNTSPYDLDNLTEKHFEAIARHGSPNTVNFSYPINKRRTKITVDTMREAEANLDRFWAYYDGFLEARHDAFKDTAVYQAITESDPILRTEEWVDQAEPEPISPPPNAAMSQPLSHMYLDLQLRTESTLTKTPETHSPLRSKIKSRHHPSGHQHSIESTSDAFTVNHSNIGHHPELTPQPPPTFQVSPRALKVFNTIFFTPFPGAIPGEIPWKDFLHAMASLNFQVKKLQGSMWQFTPPSLANMTQSTGSIRRTMIFHEPHPSKSIPFYTARRHGRRLKRVYGWTANSFVLANTKD